MKRLRVPGKSRRSGLLHEVPRHLCHGNDHLGDQSRQLAPRNTRRGTSGRPDRDRLEITLGLTVEFLECLDIDDRDLSWRQGAEWHEDLPVTVEVPEMRCKRTIEVRQRRMAAPENGEEFRPCLQIEFLRHLRRAVPVAPERCKIRRVAELCREVILDIPHLLGGECAVTADAAGPRLGRGQQPLDLLRPRRRFRTVSVLGERIGKHLDDVGLRQKPDLDGKTCRCRHLRGGEAGDESRRFALPFRVDLIEILQRPFRAIERGHEIASLGPAENGNEIGLTGLARPVDADTHVPSGRGRKLARAESRPAKLPAERGSFRTDLVPVLVIGNPSARLLGKSGHLEAALAERLGVFSLPVHCSPRVHASRTTPVSSQ